VTILITTLNLYEKVKQLVERLPSLRYIILTDAAEHLSDKILSFSTLMEQASTDFKIRKQILKMLLYSILPVELPECQGVLHVHHAVLPIT
jgi:acetyl-CoA synthetase